MTPPVYKIMTVEAAGGFSISGSFAGAEIDLRDGYIHLSSTEQVADTLARHFAGRSDLVLVTIDPDALPSPLKWEEARGGTLFPHLYGVLPWGAVRSVDLLVQGTDGNHQLPEGFPGVVSGTSV